MSNDAAPMVDSPNAINVNDAAAQITGLLGEDGNYNPDPDQLSRAHPDYDPASDSRNDKPGKQGRDASGRFAKKQPDNQDSDSATDQQNLDAENDSDTDDAGDTDDAQDQTASDDAQASTEENNEPIETLEQLAAAFDMSIEDMLGQLNHTFTAAGEEVTVNLSEMLKGYQKDADYRRGTSELSTARRAMEADMQQRTQFFEQSHAILANQLNTVEQMISARLNSPELAQLRQTNQGEWAAQREEIGEQVRQLQEARQRAAYDYANGKQQMLAAMRQREQGYLLEKRKDFSDKDAQTAREVMSSIGYAPDEIANIFDHRVVLGALEMHSLREEVKTLREEKAEATKTAAQVKKNIPQMQKGGKQQRPASGINRANARQLVNRVKKSGKLTDGAAAIEAML